MNNITEMEKIRKGSQVIHDRLLQILDEAGRPLSTRDIGVRLRFENIRLTNYQIISELRELLSNDEVTIEGNRWHSASVRHSQRQSVNFFKGLPFTFPNLSPETTKRIGSQTSAIESPCLGITGSQQRKPADVRADLIGRWGFFRRLVAYYRQCIRNEEGAKAVAFQNELYERFIYLRKVGFWYPRHGTPWQTIIPLGEHLSGLVNNLPGPTDEDTLVVGYPIQALFKERSGEPPISIIRPVFHFPVEYSIASAGLFLKNDNPQIEVNFDWLEFAFNRRGNNQSSFLTACGFINRSRPNDEAPGIERGESSPNIEGLTSALKAFMPSKIIEALKIDAIPDTPLKTPFDTGIYNRAVLMVAKKTRFTVTLLKELAAIERASDRILDQTALRMVFAQEEHTKQPLDDLIHEETVIDTTLLNAEQRLAVASLLKRPLTIVTGPPGTGKSQVVSATATNARLQNQSLLFASRNHKAIDAVYNRLVDDDGQTLMVRTNSKEDPNLNFTFSHAIGEMLLHQLNPGASRQLSFVKEEISQLLRQRGETALIIKKVAYLRSEIGRLEEKMAHLSRDLPHGMAPYLDVRPSSFPYKSISHISLISKSFAQTTTHLTIFQTVVRFWRCAMLTPLYWLARRKLKVIPGTPGLRLWLTPKELHKLYGDFILLEKAAQYSKTRIKCRPLEDEARIHPPLEVLTTSISEITQRLEEIVQRAISLDLNDRKGLPEGVSREKMDGLKTTLRAMRTGLDEGKIRAEAISILKERAPHVLHSFPCWAVTNLSAGSRLPLMPGLFDLVIVDEASQSDIPSAIPLLFRAKRVGVVGDPFQLTHCSKLSTAKDTLLQREIGITRIEDTRFSYSDHSLYDLLAGTNDAEPVFLSETYRSATEIAGYSNDIFYSGRLRVATDLTHLKAPHGVPPGIHWTEVEGDVKSGGGSGCFCQEEVDTILNIVREMLVKNKFRGSLGIVTPFRKQANRIRDALYESDSNLYYWLEASQTHIDTAHGFQGDERDVIIFSLCAGSEMPVGSKGFLRENANLFNVAASRARAVLHIVGNRKWARNSKIRHIERLTAAPQKADYFSPRGPWHPHDSPFEKMLFDALIAVGLEPRPQFPVASRRLDIALIKKGEPPLKIDIEVDGACHRNSDGSRKTDDTWRDIQLQAMGWKVLRFWTYQLREDMKGCVSKIQKAWSENE